MRLFLINSLLLLFATTSTLAAPITPPNHDGSISLDKSATPRARDESGVVFSDSMIPILHGPTTSDRVSGSEDQKDLVHHADSTRLLRRSTPSPPPPYQLRPPTPPPPYRLQPPTPPPPYPPSHGSSTRLPGTHEISGIRSTIRAGRWNDLRPAITNRLKATATHAGQKLRKIFKKIP